MGDLKKTRWDMITSSAICVVLGAVLIFFPDAVNDMISYVIAAAMFLVALIEFYNYFKKDIKSEFYRNDLVFGVVALVAGFILLAKVELIKSLIPIVLGAFIIVSGVKKLQNALDLIRLKLSGWKSLLVLCAINIIFGVIMVVCALQTAKVITALIGVGLVYSGVTDIFSVIWVSRNAKKSCDANREFADLVEIDDTEKD